MFKSMVKDFSGTADICSVIPNLNKALAVSYLLPGETLLFALASAKEEFAFTNEALLTLIGENATTTRKIVTRYDYRDHPLTRVQFETTGRMDRDCEIKFQIGEFPLSIDIAKKEEDAVKVHYKALVLLAHEQEVRARRWHLSQLALNESSDAMRLTGHTDVTLSLTGQADTARDWLTRDFERVHPRTYHDTLQPALASAARR